MSTPIARHCVNWWSVAVESGRLAGTVLAYGAGVVGDRVLNRVFPLDLAQHAAVHQAAAQANGCPGRGDGNDQQEGTESSSGALQRLPAGDQGSTESEWLGNSEPTDPASPTAQQQRIAWRLRNAGVTSAHLAAVRDALVDEDFSAVNVDDAEFSPGAVSVPPTPPAPGHSNPSPFSGRGLTESERLGYDLQTMQSLIDVFWCYLHDRSNSDCPDDCVVRDYYRYGYTPGEGHLFKRDQVALARANHCPIPGHLDPSSASAPAAHHRVAGGNSPGAACDTPLSPAPGHPTTAHLLLDAANQLSLWRDGARMSDRRSDRLDELIPEMHARANELDGMDAAKDAAFTTVVEQHAEALRHLD